MMSRWRVEAPTSVSGGRSSKERRLDGGRGLWPFAARPTGTGMAAAGLLNLALAGLPLLGVAVPPTSALAQEQVAPIRSIGVTGDTEVVRVAIDARAGAIGSVELGNVGSPTLRIEVRGMQPTELEPFLRTLQGVPDLVERIEVLPGLAGRSIVLIGFSRPMRVLDETLVAGAARSTRWEMVLAEAPTRSDTPGRAVLGQRLDQILLGGEGDRLDITLSGSLGLEADVSVAESPNRLILDLPGVALPEIERAVQGLRAIPPMIRRVRAVPSATGGGQIAFELRGAIDLVDVRGSVSGDVGSLLVAAVPDESAGRGADTLRAIRTVAAEGEVRVVFDGAEQATVNSYTLADPPRLVVDFLGWSPERVKDAVTAFRSTQPVVSQAGLTTTRLGSARLVFALDGPVSTSPPVRRRDQLALGLRALPDPVFPGGDVVAGMLGQQNVLPGHLLDLRRPPASVRPLELAPRVPGGPVAGPAAILAMLDTALVQDPVYSAVRAEFEAVREGLPQARSGYLPVAAFEYQRALLRQDINKTSNEAFPTGVRVYGTQSLSLTITQPLVRIPVIYRMEQAKLSIDQAELNLLAAEQNLIFRLASAYVGLLAATDNLDLARAERDATGQQLQLARSRLQSGLTTQVQLSEAEGRHALNEARVIEAVNLIEDARGALREITGQDVERVPGLRRDFRANAPVPSTADAWVRAALEQNLALQTRNIAVEISDLEVSRQRAGHLPTVDIVGNYGRQRDDGSIYGERGQEIDTGSVMLRLRVPLYEGGLTSSLTREARARRTKTEMEREEERRKIQRATTTAFLRVQASVGTLEALRKSVQAQEDTLHAKARAFESGVETVVEVVDAYRLYFAARRDFMRVRYDYLIGRLQLKQLIGTLTRDDLADIAALLE